VFWRDPGQGCHFAARYNWAAFSLKISAESKMFRKSGNHGKFRKNANNKLNQLTQICRKRSFVFLFCIHRLTGKWVNVDAVLKACVIGKSRGFLLGVVAWTRDLSNVSDTVSVRCKPYTFCSCLGFLNSSLSEIHVTRLVTDT
jgi:hypothetical protein